MDDLHSALSGQFRIDRELGGGGMSRVFLAEELALGRRVVIKILPDEIAHTVSVQRFKREIALAAQLTHPHIVPLITAGDVEGRPYYVMPYIDGETLRTRIARGPLEIHETIRLLRQVISALGAAHSHGVVHRDIKPENIFLSGDTAVIADFGVAKALVASTQVEGTRGITEIGLALGTPAYMAPEQALADTSTDHRADLYAFGCVAYEMLAGTPPFKGATAAQLVAAHVRDTPPPIDALRPELPAALSQLVMQCLEKDPDQRPSDAQTVARGLDAIPVASGSTFATHHSDRRRTRSRLIVAGVLLLATVVAAGYAVRSRAAAKPLQIPMLAVLPLDNQGADSTRYFVDGLGSAISDRLASLGGLRVIDHKSAISVAKSGGTSKQMGTALGADFVLNGDVRWDMTSTTRRGQLTVKLIDVRDGTQKWSSDPIAFTLSDPFSVQSSVATSVAQALDVALSAKDQAALNDRPTSNAEAYDAYLRGLAGMERAVTPAELTRALSYFVQAMQLDPAFTLARWRWVYGQARLFQLASPGATIDSMRAVVHEMVRRAPDDANTLSAQGQIALYEGNPMSPFHQRALDASPNNPTLLTARSRQLLFVGADPQVSWELIQRAARLAPRNVDILLEAAQRALQFRRTDDAQELLARVIAIDRNNAQAILLQQMLAAATGDSLAVFERFNALVATGQPVATAVNMLLLGTGAARDNLVGTVVSPATVRDNPLYATQVLFSQGEAYLVRGDSARARALFHRMYEAGRSARSSGVYIADGRVRTAKVMGAAAAGDRTAAEQVMRDNDTNLTSKRIPSTSGLSAAVACEHAESYALLGDTAAMYPRLDRCVAGPSGTWGAFGVYPAILRRLPFYAPYRDQPHFKRIVDNMIVVRKAGG